MNNELSFHLFRISGAMSFMFAGQLIYGDDTSGGALLLAFVLSVVGFLLMDQAYKQK